MSDNLENVNLSRHTFDIGLVFDLIFFQNLDCNFLASDQMSSQSYFTECALSERTTWRKWIVNKYWLKGHEQMTNWIYQLKFVWRLNRCAHEIKTAENCISFQQPLCRTSSFHHVGWRASCLLCSFDRHFKEAVFGRVEKEMNVGIRVSILCHDNIGNSIALDSQYTYQLHNDQSSYLRLDFHFMGLTGPSSQSIDHDYGLSVAPLLRCFPICWHLLSRTRILRSWFRCYWQHGYQN